MIFNGVNNQTVEFKITGRFLSETEVSPLDEEWLSIFVDVKSDLGCWQTVDPFLKVVEFAELERWFRDLSEDKDVQFPRLSFTEPSLELNLIKDQGGVKYMRMCFYAELKPKSAKDSQKYFVDLRLSRKELLDIAESLDGELNKYFQRDHKL